jgi:hypothetical protein
MSTDVLSLVSKVIDRAVEKSGYAEASLQGGSDAYAGELLIDTLASQLLHVLGIAAPAPASALSAHQDGTDLARVCAEQTNRNRALARALGACDCWGEVATCERCAGRGSPGWRRPDRVSFDMLVRPVLRKLNRDRVRRRGTPAAAL